MIPAFLTVLYVVGIFAMGRNIWCRLESRRHPLWVFVFIFGSAFWPFVPVFIIMLNTFDYVLDALGFTG